MQPKALNNFVFVGLQWGINGVLCLSLLGGSLVKGQTKTTPSQQKNSENTKMNKNQTAKESPFVCNLAALTKEQRTRTFSLLDKMKTNIQEVKELSDGYAFQFPMEATMLMEVGEFITYERLCCPFFDFEVVVEREGGPMWLRLKGREGVKDFIKAEFGL